MEVIVYIPDEVYQTLVSERVKLAGTLCMDSSQIGRFNAWRRKPKETGEEKRYKLPHGRVTITEDVTRIRMQFRHNESVAWHDMADEVDLGLEYIWRETKAK